MRQLPIALALLGLFVAILSLPAQASHNRRSVAHVRVAQTSGIGTAVTYIKGGPGAQHITGTPGDDTIDVRRGGRDTVTCGAGYDTVLADRTDRVDRASCELVTR